MKAELHCRGHGWHYTVGMEHQQGAQLSGRLTELCPSDICVAQNSIKHSQSFNAGATVAGTGFQQMEHHE